MTENIYRHKNGLKHINVVNNEGFSALFVVNTPVFDNSGVAHAVEHLVFRRSKAFPQTETLFQITSLTDAKINASTFANSTYFHCQSNCPDTFLLAINYLLNGLIKPSFTGDDLSSEIHNGDKSGVIYRELLGSEKMSENNNKESKKNEFCYGGISSTIGKLSLNDITSFHQRFYQAHNITLVTANADVEKISNLVLLLPQQNTQNKQETIKQNSSKEYRQDYEDEEQNNKKYSPSINKLIEVYQQWLHDPYYQEIDDYQEIESSADNKNINKSTNTDINSSPTQYDNNLPLPLINLSKIFTGKMSSNKLVDNTINNHVKKSILPGLFTKLYQQAKNEVIETKTKESLCFGSVNDQSNTLWLARINDSEKALATITSYIISAYPVFLMRRCQGQCYATQALTVDDATHLVIYSAFDINPTERSQEIPQCLLSLSQDFTFIRQSLTLAKVKYSQAHFVDYNQLENISHNDISTYLKATICSSHPKV